MFVYFAATEPEFFGLAITEIRIMSHSKRERI